MLITSIEIMKKIDERQIQNKDRKEQGEQKL